MNKIEIENYRKKILTHAFNTNHFKKIKLNRFWAEENLEEIDKLLKSNESIDEVLVAISLSHLYQINFTGDVQEYGIIHMLKKFEQELGEECLHSLLEKYSDGDCYPNKLTYTYKGKKITLDFFRYLAGALNINKYIKNKKIESIFELGAGMGGMARILCLMLEPKKYYICDLPQSIIFSYLFLSKNLPNYSHKLIDSVNSLNEALSGNAEKEIIYIPTNFAENISNESFDLFINTQSLGEMHNETVSFWFDFIQIKNNVSYGYFLNRFMNIYVPGEMNDWRLSENTSSVSFDGKWDILHWDHEPSFMKCPFGFTAHARPLEIICMRTSQERKIFNSEYEVLRYYDNLDLFSKNFSMNNYLHKYSAVNIASDGVKGSALYYIWESLRQFSDSLDVNKRAAHFMKTIRKEQKLVFEEEPFIWKRIQKIDAIAGRAYVKENFEYKGNDKVINEQSNGSVLNRIIKRIIRHVKAY